VVEKGAAVGISNREVGIDEKYLGDVANPAERSPEALSSSWRPTRWITDSS